MTIIERLRFLTVTQFNNVIVELYNTPKEGTRVIFSREKSMTLVEYDKPDKN